MTQTNYQLTVYWARLVFEVLQREKLDAVNLFRESGLDVSKLTQPDAYFDVDCFSRLWQSAVELSGNPAIGLQMGFASPLDAFGDLSTRFLSSKNLRDSLEQAKAYYRIVGSAMELEINETPESCKITIKSKGNKLPAPLEGYDATLALITNSLKAISTKPIIPQYVAFAYPEPKDLSPYQEFFDCPLRFSSDNFYIALDSAALDQPLLFSNPDIAKQLDRELSRAIKVLKDAPLPQQVSYIIEKMLPFGEPTMQKVAQQLYMSTRSLQRKLHAENRSFRELLEEVRKTLAAEYVRDPEIHLQDIYYNLGFNDHSNFYRAFRRWYGCSPGAYREKVNKP